ncbi:MAG: ZIP family zinc transporter [Candidatus Moranbacteria bacterium]|nr:ZIP family zinc transporter [Candidatus Moranbacteria bacterium]
MTQVIFYGIASGFSLLIGAGMALYFSFSQKTIARFMAFGSGVLVCALTFGLMEEAFGLGGFDATIIGFLLGGLAFILGDYTILRLGGRHKRKFSGKKELNGKAIVLGALLDGVPESAALGIALFAGKGLGFLMLAAIFLSNLPEGISSVPGLLREKFTKKFVLSMWLVASVVLALIVVASYFFLREIDPNNLGIIEAFAAGAILAMLADTMMPEAFEEGGATIGLLTVLGFIVAFVASRL